MQGIDTVSTSASLDLRPLDLVAPHADKNPVNGKNPDDAALFSAMMKSDDFSSVVRLAPASANSSPSIIERIASTQNAELRDVFQSTREMMQAAPYMTTSEMVSVGNEMSLKVALTTMQFTVAASFGKSASTAVQTLMKNQ